MTWAWIEESENFRSFIGHMAKRIDRERTAERREAPEQQRSALIDTSFHSYTLRQICGVTVKVTDSLQSVYSVSESR